MKLYTTAISRREGKAIYVCLHTLVKRLILVTRETIALLEALSLSHQQRMIVLYLHDFTLGEGAGGLWLRSMGCHAL